MKYYDTLAIIVLLVMMPISVFGQKKSNAISWRKLQGVWAETKDSDPYFLIAGKFAYYPEHLKPCRITLHGKILTFYIDGFGYKSTIVYLSNDSLVLREDDAPSILEKFVKQK